MRISHYYLSFFSYRVSSLMIDPSLLLQFYSKNQNFFDDLLTVHLFDEKLPADRDLAMEDTFSSFMDETDYKYAMETVEYRLFFTSYYFYQHKGKNLKWFSIFSKNHKKKLTRYFDILSMSSHFITQVAPPEETLSFFIPLLSSKKHEYGSFFEKETERFIIPADDIEIIINLLPYLMTQNHEKYLRQKLCKYVDLSVAEWDLYGNQIRYYSLAYYVYHAFQNTGQVQNLEEYFHFYENVEEYWKKLKKSDPVLRM